MMKRAATIISQKLDGRRDCGVAARICEFASLEFIFELVSIDSHLSIILGTFNGHFKFELQLRDMESVPRAVATGLTVR